MHGAEKGFKVEAALGVLLLILLSSVSGFLPFFFGSLHASSQIWLDLHTWLSLALLLPYGVYQYQHYQRVRRFKHTQKFKLGLIAFASMSVVVVSGFALIARQVSLIELVHILAGFSFLVALACHLALIAQKVQCLASANTNQPKS